MKTYTPEEWVQLAEQIHDLLISHICALTSETTDDFTVLQIASGYQFFRMIRGEAFLDRREPPVSKYQDRLYELEKSLLEAVKKVDTSKVDAAKIARIKEIFWL